MTLPGTPFLPPEALPIDGGVQTAFEIVLVLLVGFALVTLSALLWRAVSGVAGRARGAPRRGLVPKRWSDALGARLAPRRPLLDPRRRPAV